MSNWDNIIDSISIHWIYFLVGQVGLDKRIRFTLYWGVSTGTGYWIW